MADHAAEIIAEQLFARRLVGLLLSSWR